MVFGVAQPARRSWRENFEQCGLGVCRDIKRSGGGIFLEPVAMTGTRDRHDVVRSRQNPGERQLGGGTFFGNCVLLQLRDQPEIAVKIVALKARHVPSGIARTQCPDIRDFAG